MISSFVMFIFFSVGVVSGGRTAAVPGIRADDPSPLCPPIRLYPKMPGLSTGDLHFGPVRCIIIQEDFASAAAGNMKAASGNTE